MTASPSVCRLEEVVDPARPITYGIVLPGPDVPDGTPYIRVVDMQGGTVSTTGLRRTTAEIARKYRRSAVRPGDVLLSIRGHVGRVAIVPEGLDGANLTQDTARIALRGCEARYVAWALRSPAVQRWMVQRTKGVAVQGINLSDVKEIPVAVRPVAEQRRIAAILDEADALRRKRRESLALLDDLVHSAFVEIVGEGNPHHASWPLRRVEDLAASTPSAMRTGPFGSALLHSEFVDDGIAVLGIDNAVQNRFAWGERRFITREKYEELRRYTVFPNDVIITIMGTTGRSAVVPAEVPTAITTKHLATITPNTSLVRPDFLSNAIHRDSGVLRQIGTKNRGAIMDGLNLGIIRELEVRVPPLETQQTFEHALSEIRSLEVQQRAGLDEAQRLFDSLLHRAFSGEL